MNISVLIPWRTDHGPRAEAFEYLLPRWVSTGVDVCVGEDDPAGPFNFSRACNRAFRTARYDKLAIYGADCVPDLGALSEAEDLLERYPWLPLYQQTGYYSRGSTAKILRSEEPCHVFPFEHLVPFCTGVMAVSRAAYIESGGMDERFAGWGMEDAAFRHTLHRLYPDVPSLTGTLACLWHDESERGRASQANWDLVRSYEAVQDRPGMETYLRERGSFL